MRKREEAGTALVSALSLARKALSWMEAHQESRLGQVTDAHWISGLTVEVGDGQSCRPSACS